MHIETIELPTSGYGTPTPTLTTYIQDNLASQEGRLRPAVVICPGGAYRMCSDREAEPIALAWVARGFQAVVLDYTVFDEDEASPLLPHPQRDLAHAVATVRAHAGAWHVDPERIAMLGCSAGGHLCASYSRVMRDPAFAAELGLSCDDMAVSAQVLCYPVIDFTCGWPSDAFYAHRLDPTEALAHAQNLVDAATPRTFLWHTATDATVPVANAYRYAEALASHGVDHECHVFHRGRHGLSLATAQTGEDDLHRDAHVAAWLDLAAEWLEEGWA